MRNIPLLLGHNLIISMNEAIYHTTSPFPPSSSTLHLVTMHVAHSFIFIATMVLGALSQGSPDSLQPMDPDAPSGPDVKWTVPPEDVEMLQWTEPAFKAEEKAKSGGLIEDVLDKMLNVKLNWRYAYKLDRKRQPKKISSTVRCGGWRSGDMHRIEHLISVLRRPSAPPRYSLNAGKCARIACEENASITWCNDVSGN